MTKTFEDDLVLEEDTTFKQSIEVEGDIRGKDGKKIDRLWRERSRFDLTVHGHIDAKDIEAKDIEANNIDAKNIEARHIEAKNIDAKNIDACHIDARDIDTWNIYAWDIDARDINALDICANNIDAKNIEAKNIGTNNIDAKDISFYAFCIAYKNIRCTSIEGQRNNSKYLALDGKVEIKEKPEKCPECGQKIEEVEN